MPVLEEIKQLENFELANRLPASYNVENSNISLLLEIVKEQINELSKSILDVETINNIDLAFGKTLDYIGSDYLEERNGENDEEFLKRIKNKKMASGSFGDMDTIIEGIAEHFKCPESFFTLKRVGTKKIEIIYPTHFSEAELIKTLVNLKAAGIIYILTKDKFWEDYTYEQLAQFGYEHLEELRYQKIPETFFDDISKDKRGDK